MKVYVYISTPPLGLRGLFWDELYLYLVWMATPKKGG